MESKTFTGDSAAAIIKAVNDWLDTETGVTVRRTENHEDDTHRITFTVWYSRTAK
jgi:hypothetical protein